MEYEVARSAVVLFIRLVDLLVRLDYGLVQFFFFISFLAGFRSSNRTTALNLEHFPILLVYSHIRPARD